MSSFIDTERKRFKVLVSNMHRLDFANIHILRAFSYLQNGFSLVVKFRSDMPTCIIIPLYSNAVLCGYANYIHSTIALIDL